MRQRADESTDQAEFTFSSDFRRPRGVPSSPRPPSKRTERRSPPPLPRTPRRRRGVAPASRRLTISPEAFDGSEGASEEAGAGYGGVVEVAVAILATMAFGLGWAAYELDFELPTSSSAQADPISPIALEADYALVAPTTPFGLAGAEEAEWTTTNRDARAFTPTDDSSAR